jgi:hypothetical protein
MGDHLGARRRFDVGARLLSEKRDPKRPLASLYSIGPQSFSSTLSQVVSPCCYFLALHSVVSLHTDAIATQEAPVILPCAWCGAISAGAVDVWGRAEYSRYLHSWGVEIGGRMYVCTRTYCTLSCTVGCPVRVILLQDQSLRDWASVGAVEEQLASSMVEPICTTCGGEPA